MPGVTDQQLDLLDSEALAASRNSYSPYSHFRVGAAVLTADGSIVHGCNVESASYGLSLCAERCAIFTARALGHLQPHQAIAVVCPGASASDVATVMSCGACRQVIAEMMEPDAIVSVVGVGRFHVAELLPNAFAIRLRES